MKIAVLTSSRADYGIYRPLLKRLEEDPFFDLHLIVFGTHLSPFHGNTISQILEDQFTIDHKVTTQLAADSEDAIAASMALTMMKFSSIWENADYDLVICLGDRYEMFAAVSAGTPFNIKFAHIHGGETTLGAFDNAFRHSISLFSKLHFTSTQEYAERVKEITQQKDNIYNVGALSLDNLMDIELYSAEEFMSIFGIDIQIPFLLMTFHPETIHPEDTRKHSAELLQTLKEIPEQIVVTMPNADTNSSNIREMLYKLKENKKNLILVENFGTRGYFTCMKNALMLIGNTSSGIIESASFGKFVINIGDRQKGRAAGENVIHVPVNKSAILDAYRYILKAGSYQGANIYYRENVSGSILKTLKTLSL
jgi:GDP/UDP-N,N'-diacetylbacillosamine 2-epimerase (hydrolysing)